MNDRVMSSLPGRRRLAARLVFTLLTAVALTSCTSKAPSEPSAAGTTPSPNVSIVSMDVASETLVSGARVYRVTVKLRESGGAAATIASVDLSFMNGTSVVTSSHIDRPISDAANVLAANSTIDTREFLTTDEDRTHPHATSVVAKVSYTYGAALTRSADGSAAVPLSAAPTFTLSGVVTEENTAGRPIAGGLVQVVDGANAGKSASTDGNGSYTLADLASGSFTVRATAGGYNAAERAVTINEDTRLDLRLLRPSGSAPPPSSPPSGNCAYTFTPVGGTPAPNTSYIDYKGGSLSATISRTSGACSWQASADVSWITFPGGASGNGSGTLTYVVAPGGLNSRTGNVTISWTGGSAQIRVLQGNAPDWSCNVAAIKGSQDFDNVPSNGGQLTIALSVTISPPGWDPRLCGAGVSSSDSWISGSGTAVGGSPAVTVTFTVGANSSGPHPRTGTIVATGGSQPVTIAVRQQ